MKLHLDNHSNEASNTKLNYIINKDESGNIKVSYTSKYPTSCVGFLYIKSESPINVARKLYVGTLNKQRASDGVDQVLRDSTVWSRRASRLVFEC